MNAAKLRACAGPGLLVAVGAYLAGRAAVAWLADGRSLAVILAPAAVVAALTVAGFLRLALTVDRADRTRRYRIDPGGLPANAINHEVAHVDKGAQFGGRTVGGAVYPDGSGWVDVRLPRRATPAQDIAVDMAGAHGEGVSFWWSPHAAGDRANAAARVAHLSPAAQQQVYREAERLSYRRTWQSGQAAAVRRALQTSGRYR